MTTWGQGDYPLMAERLEPAALAVVEAAGVRAGERVLDVAAGTGNAALLAAARGGRVVGVDFEPALLAVAARRARERGLAVRWLTGDAGALPVAGESADVVVSVFGVMYAGDQAGAGGAGLLDSG
ncbi:MAG: class I SAM-dependent methyltransferase, partial [Trebonia sp.]